MANWLTRGETARPAIHLSVDEGIIVAALAAAGRTYSPTLLDASWQILRHSLRAFATLHEFETAYGDFDKETQEELFSPFTSLRPLVLACSKNGFESLDLVIPHISYS
ncbi:Pentatricopeptide repeat-containing protein At1g26460, mitochondrial [Linum perenne]